MNDPKEQVQYLVDAIEEWIRCEYAFRCGKAAYTDITAMFFSRAIDELRAAATGTTDLEQAAQGIGIDTELIHEQLRERFLAKRAAHRRTVATGNLDTGEESIHNPKAVPVPSQGRERPVYSPKPKLKEGLFK